ncbi:MAG: exopolyphosphatase [Pseudomonadota bacterium]
MPKETPASKLPKILAAVDLGSNSFHMIIARVAQGRLHVLDRMRETVRLAAGLDKKNTLRPNAQKRALNCLQRFGQSLRGLPPDSVRAVGTNTLRVAQNSANFLRTAQRALGHPIEIIGGHEEARLIYLGVARSLAPDAKRRLVIDIGGGSTECIIGEGFRPLHMESLPLGCVGATLKYFPRGVIDRAAFARAEIAALQELQPIAARYRALGWQMSIGASGTVKAVLDVVQAQRWSDNGITLASLRKLRKRLFAAGHVRRLKLAGLRDDRLPVFPGGVAILLAVFESLGIKRMLYSDGALREGLLFDLLGRIRHEDIRDATVTNLCARYHVDMRQAARVERTALHCLQQTNLQRHADALRWAARLHEIGLAVSHSQYRKHSAYLVENSDMPGFSRPEQQLLTVLILGQRGKFPLINFQTLPDDLGKTAQRLCLLLRFAVLLNRSRSAQPPPKFTVQLTAKTLRIKFPRGWLAKHPLTKADLEQEKLYLKPAKINLRIS